MFDIIVQICSILFAFFVFIWKDVFCMSQQQNVICLRCEVFMTVHGKAAVVRDMASYSMVDLPDYTTSSF